MAWLDIFLVPVAVIYLVVVTALFIYGLNFFHLAQAAWHHRFRQDLPNRELPEEWPEVTVQLPIYNEWYVAVRLIKAAAELEYPRDRLEIQVLDDSTDETTDLVARTVARLQAEGLDIRLIHRLDRSGFKAGALGNALASARGEFISIFDADFVPPADFLKRTLVHFDHPRVAFVQARWGHLNREYSLITFLQSLSIDVHFAVEQFARSRQGYWFNFNGTAGVWRKEAILDAGGWKAETLTEDLDLSYRAFLRGWESRYAGEVEVPAELPVSFSAYRRQQYRWARGSLECAIRFLPQIWRSDEPLRRKLEASLHLTGYGVHLLLFALALLYPLVLLMAIRYPGLIGLFGIALFFNATAFAPTIFFAVAQRSLGRRWIRLLPAILFMTVLGAGMMLNTLRAAIQIWQGRSAGFERTPKYGITQKRQAWDTSRYRARVDNLVLFEIAIGILNLITVGLAFRLGNWLIMVYAGLFSLGLFFTSGFTLAQALVKRRQPGNRSGA